jgi:hypothetical protein
MICPNIKQNEGTHDRAIRVIIGSISLLTAFFWLSGVLQVVASIIGVIALVTGLVGFCGLYTVFGISTCKTKK